MQSIFLLLTEEMGREYSITLLEQHSPIGYQAEKKLYQGQVITKCEHNSECMAIPNITKLSVASNRLLTLNDKFNDLL